MNVKIDKQNASLGASNTSGSNTSGNADPNDPFHVPVDPGNGSGPGSEPGQQGNGNGQGCGAQGCNDPKCKGDCKHSKNGQGQGQGQQPEPERMEKFDFKDIEPGDTIEGTVRFSATIEEKGDYPVVETLKDRKIKLDIGKGRGTRNIRFSKLKEDCVLVKTSRLPKSAKPDKSILSRIMAKKGIEDETAANIIALYEAGIRNFWMVGPAGCGKTTIANIVAKALNSEFYLVSCSVGTSPAKFVGRMYPEPKPTHFGRVYEEQSVIVVDEFTALDPAVAQALNAALANDMMEITTETAKDKTDVVKRHKDCIIIGTSNTFGTGASPTYNANNQLDASTRDRFQGGIIEVDYSAAYESQFDTAVVNFVWAVRECIKKNNLARIASTRMIQAGVKLKKYGFEDWTGRLLTDWTVKELKLLLEHFHQNKVPIALKLGNRVPEPDRIKIHGGNKQAA